jgi:hypothetical protein
MKLYKIDNYKESACDDSLGDGFSCSAKYAVAKYLVRLSER